jgi:Matrixin/Putative peptidoglycan binding domain
MAENAGDRHAEMLSQEYDADVIREAPDLESGAEDPSLVEVQNFLKHYGYLDYEFVAQGETPEAGRLDDVTGRALTEFQRRYNVGTPGILDAPTREFMAAPRCGMPDLVAGPSPFFSTRCAWTRRNLTYAFGNPSSDVTSDVARNAVRRAFNTWATAGVGLSFTEVATTANPDIFVEWRQANDPDLSMVGNTLAHADFPPGCTVVINPPNGTPPQPVHFDDSEHAWADGAAANSFDIETVALHEIGHCLGLMHTTVSGSVMFPSVSSNFTLRALQPDDNAGIRALYPPISQDIPWDPIGHANNVVAMAAINVKLFAATSDNILWWRDPVGTNVNWDPIGHANNVVAMTAINNKLFAATSDNRLWWRDPVGTNVNWDPIGHANNVVAMAAINNKLFAATSDNRLWWRDPVGIDVNWDHIGHANDVVAMTAINNKLFAATSDNRLWWRDPVGIDVNWDHIGHANDVVAMAAINNKLFAATSNNILWWRDPVH